MFSVFWGSTGVFCVLGFNWCFLFATRLAPRDLHRRAAYPVSESTVLIYHGDYHNLFVFFLDDSLTS